MPERISVGLPHLCLGGEVEDGARAVLREDVGQVGQVRIDQGAALAHSLGVEARARQIRPVEHHDLLAPRQQPFDERAADQALRAGDEGAQLPPATAGRIVTSSPSSTGVSSPSRKRMSSPPT